MLQRLGIVFMLVLFCACATKKEILYLQDIDTQKEAAISYSNPTLQPNDVLRIDVGALNPESAIPYNLPTNNNQGGGNVQFLQLQGYLVSPDYTINFPVLGEISVAQLTTPELERHLKQRLEDENHLIAPSVNVRLLNAKVTVLGEVNAPGTYSFTEQNITLLQALGYAGDLTINGVREDVVVMRDEKGVKQITHIDLTTSDWMNGPYYFVRPNDVIVVNQNNPKVKTAGYIGNIGTLLSVVTITLTLTLLLTR
ncbi:polysaccharide biosynthesis/export family protein [Winogradskyella aurantia]|uniref:Ligand-binding protein n=1 Tax=Winogradskyella aurantia TaxID=1915063 RepID=A0A265UVQ1_9FLAO|nr:polysaccharide biosynthesis/export family protein [Winogradskyella aurantia]OZV69393.1 ligand-binding protein [Winogradskyella aurantia]